jgi:hypothetical protein
MRMERLAHSTSQEYTDALIVNAAKFSKREMLATRRSGFRVIIICHDDGQRVQFDAMNTPYGLTISPTLAGRKVTMVLANYKPQTQKTRNSLDGVTG